MEISLRLMSRIRGFRFLRPLCFLGRLLPKKTHHADCIWADIRGDDYWLRVFQRLLVMPYAPERRYCPLLFVTSLENNIYSQYCPGLVTPT
ncbi:hypothetical protein I7I50_05725 [Histoplasma capsulatum G186AR]|uniref:Uncharacterized protein n=1 Tax=Ajellomyces capsulatus TaxID=5037 RepID=A0A8H7ZCN7_AJECA|nr:hypothetical protein I7I52_03985 [Histoplasma capsulatum]QSS76316.1 hypothetical protein I7I50_05725 [Histoplasma capsulatum G186AR]